MQKKLLLANSLKILFYFLALSVHSQVNSQDLSPVKPVAYSTLASNYIKTWEATAPEQNVNNLISRNLRDVKQTSQYFDGLGVLLQTVVKQGSLPTAGAAVDLVSPLVYDEYGREIRKYLPFSASSYGGNASINDGGFKLNPFDLQQQFYSDANSNSPVRLQGETYYYGKSNFEKSQLNRVVESYSPGNSWVGSEGGTKRGTKVNFGFNSLIDSVRIWNVVNNSNPNLFGSYSTSGIYAAGMLSKIISTDEHGKQVIEFKDKDGRVILKKSQLTATPDMGVGKGHTGWLCTYYIFDEFGLLRCVIQPRGIELISSTWLLVDAAILKEQCFRYEYDIKYRMIVKQVPGAGTTTMLYDLRDRLVMTQDANQEYWGKGYTTTLYDNLNRAIKTFKLPTDEDRSTVQIELDYNANYVTQYSDMIIPGGEFGEVYTETHYDDYDNLPAGLYATLYNSGYGSYLNASSTSPDYAEAVSQSLNVKGLVTWTKTKVLETVNQYIYTVIIYDAKGRIIQVQSTNITGGLDVVTNQYSFSNQLLRSHKRHQKLGGVTQTIEIASKNNYDDLGRVTGVEKNIQNGGWKVISSIAYDALGQLKSKKLSPSFNSGNGLETISYQYNIRGWMLGANKDYLSNGSATSNYFGMELNYDKDGYTTTNQKQFSGNIGSAIWRSQGDGIKRKYDYDYDAVNRLLKADFTQLENTFWTNTNVNFNVKMGNGVDPTQAYDANGNILRMQQWGLKLNSSLQIDDLKYYYWGNSNRLRTVIDGFNDSLTRLGDFRTSIKHPEGSTAPSKWDYLYDPNGNLTRDLNKDIGTDGDEGIEYNFLNLPKKIFVFEKGDIELTYDANGRKLKKHVIDNSVSPSKSTTTTYIDEFIYENDSLQFLSQEEGRIRYKPNNSSFIYDYFLKDHLGNVRMVLTEEQQTITYPAATLEGTYDANSNSMINYEKQFYNINNTKVVSESSIASWPTESVANSKLYYNHNGNPPSNINYPPSCTPIQTDGSNKLYKLNALSNKVGLEFMIKVMSGDKIDIFGKSYFLNTGTINNSNSTPLNLLELMGNLLLSPANAAVGKGATSSTLNSLNSGLIPNSFFRGANGETTTIPKAYINYILLDEQFKYVSGSASRVGSSGVVKDHWYSDAQLQNIPVVKNGYIFVYVSNESNLDVFFDNLQVIHKPGPILEETHYYPFGLTMAGISSKATAKLENKKRYNGIEFDNDFDINEYEAFYRNLDPQTGRWWQIDPETSSMEAWSTYASNYDNPIRYFDFLGNRPDGEEGAAGPPDPKAVIKLGNLIWRLMKAADKISEIKKLDVDEIITIFSPISPANPESLKHPKHLQKFEKKEEDQSTPEAEPKAETTPATQTRKSDKVVDQKPGERALNQQDGITKRQDALKKRKVPGQKKQSQINSTKKSDQGVRTELKKVKTLKDAQENF